MISMSFKNLFWHSIGNLRNIYNIARDVINKKKKKNYTRENRKTKYTRKKYI